MATNKNNNAVHERSSDPGLLLVLLLVVFLMMLLLLLPLSPYAEVGRCNLSSSSMLMLLTRTLVAVNNVITGRVYL